MRKTGVVHMERTMIKIGGTEVNRIVLLCRVHTHIQQASYLPAVTFKRLRIAWPAAIRPITTPTAGLLAAFDWSNSESYSSTAVLIYPAMPVCLPSLCAATFPRVIGRPRLSAIRPVVSVRLSAVRGDGARGCSVVEDNVLGHEGEARQRGVHEAKPAAV